MIKKELKNQNLVVTIKNPTLIVPPITPGGNMPYTTPGGNQVEANEKEQKPILIESAAIRSFYTSTPSH